MKILLGDLKEWKQNLATFGNYWISIIYTLTYMAVFNGGKPTILLSIPQFYKRNKSTRRAFSYVGVRAELAKLNW